MEVDEVNHRHELLPQLPLQNGAGTDSRPAASGLVSRSSWRRAVEVRWALGARRWAQRTICTTRVRGAWLMKMMYASVRCCISGRLGGPVLDANVTLL